jgi:hypothetical protein
VQGGRTVSLAYLLQRHTCVLSLPGIPIDCHAPDNPVGAFTKVRSGASNPNFTLNPKKAMFHAFISYRSSTDSNAVGELFKRIAFDCRSGRQIPLREETKFLDNFSRNELANKKLMNLFWDKETLANGVDWTGDGRRVNGRFIGVLMQSLVFVPLLTCYFEDKKLSNESQGTKVSVSGSIGQMLVPIDESSAVVSSQPQENVTDISHYSGQRLKPNDAKRDDLDNFLLELAVVKFLWLYQKTKNQEHRGSLWPCSFIFPIFGPNMKENILSIFYLRLKCHSALE